MSVSSRDSSQPESKFPQFDRVQGGNLRRNKASSSQRTSKGLRIQAWNSLFILSLLGPLPGAVSSQKSEVRSIRSRSYFSAKVFSSYKESKPSALLQKSNVSEPGAVATGSRCVSKQNGGLFWFKESLDPVATAPGSDTRTFEAKPLRMSRNALLLCLLSPRR